MRCKACNCILTTKDLAADPLQELCLAHLIGMGVRLFDNEAPQEDEDEN